MAINLKIDIENVCRTCLKTDELINLFQDSDDFQLIEKIMTCTFIQISPKDELPKKICLNCVDQINQSYLFAKKCEEVDEILRKYIKKNNKKVTLNNSTIQQDVIEISQNSLPKNKIVLNNNESATNGDSFQINFDPSIYTDHTYENNILNRIIKEESIKIIDSENNRSFEENPKSYTCKKCDAEFPLYHQLKEHFKSAGHSKNRYSNKPCPICSKVISYRNLKHHIQTHTAEKQFCCEFCGKRFIVRWNLIRHKRIHSGEKPYICDICGKSFNQSTAMKIHKRIHTGEKPFVCNYCGKAFAQFSYFKFHIKKHDKDGNEPKKKTKDNSINSELQCDVCNLIFKSNAALKTHKVSHEEKKFTCCDCGRGFTDMQRLQNHLKSHSNNKRFSCHICGKMFLQNTGLKLHLLIHTGEKPHVCSICQRGFVQIGQLKYHMRTHSGEKPYLCSVCGKKFALNGNLTVHMRIHTGETPYLCPVCNKGFYDSSSMKKHMRVH